MATTTNFGWETPDDTDLVKDGAAAIRTLGQAIDTSMADLEGGTTGQVLAKNSNTDMDFIWTNGGDITEVTAGTGISGGGTSGAVTITNSMATAIDAKGDLIGGTGADTFSRLAVGTNNQVLTADSAQATGLKWATPVSGSLTLLSTTVPTASSSTVTISSISGSYTHLMVVALGIRSNSGASTTGINIRFNGNTSSTAYCYQGSPASSLGNIFYLRGNTAESANVMMVYNYAQTSYVKPVYGQGVAGDLAGGAVSGQQGWGYFNSTSAISSMELIAGSSATYQATGAIYVYGVN